MSESDVAQREKQAGEPNPDRNSRIRLLVLALVVGGAYYVGALIGFALTLPENAVSTLWPPNSILLAALLLTPTQRWWVVLAGAFPAHLIVQLQGGVPMPMVLAWFMSNCAEALIGAFVIRCFISGPVDFATLKCIIAYLGSAVLLAPFLTTFLDAAFVVLVGWKGDAYWAVWLQRLLSNVLAALTISPFILLWFGKGTVWLRGVSLQRYGEGLLVICGSLVVSFLVFGWDAPEIGSTPALVYLPLPFLLWAAMRFGPRGASTLLLLLAFGSIWGAAQGRGPFTSSSQAENVLSLQIFLIAVSLPLMVLAALVEESREKAQALVETESRFRAMAETATDVIMTLDRNSTILFANPAVVNVFGYTPRELVGRKITVLMPESLRQRHEEGMRRYLQTGRKSLSWNSVSFPGLHKSGREITLDISFTEFEMGDTCLFTGIMRDVTERKRAESRQNTQYAITRILSGSDSIADAAPQLIQSICECLDWEFGEIWQVDRETDLLTCCETWHLPSKDLAEFASASRQFSFSSGVGLPGRVWQSGTPAWVSELAVDGSFLRRSLAKDAGLCSAFAFPIVVGEETLGIMVFFSREIREPNEDLVQMMASIGRQMGQFAERKRTEDALRESEIRLQLGMEAARFGYWEVEVSTGKATRSPSLERILGRAPGSMAKTRDGFFALVHPDDLEIALRQVERCIETSEFTDMEYRIIRPDGTIRWMASRGQAVLGPDGRVSRVLGMTADISERKRAEEELKKALTEVRRLKEQLEAENVYLRSEVSGAYRYGEIIGESQSIRKILEQVEQVAPTDMTVLILGETGTGKELVARLVHEKSGRRERPLVKVNCSALPAELIESELFGHERGAFTGAVSKQVGRFELADQGSIFLDEVGELPLGLQSKLLRVLQEGEFERVGSGKTIKVDVRVIAATNRNLSEAVQSGRFRADLYYRLNVYPIQISPLRERKEDISLLAEVFLRDVAGFMPEQQDCRLRVVAAEDHPPGALGTLDRAASLALTIGPAARAHEPNASRTSRFTTAPSARPLTLGITALMTRPASCGPETCSSRTVSITTRRSSSSLSCGGRYSERMASSRLSFFTRSSLPPLA